jgi:hypothetical protein
MESLRLKTSQSLKIHDEFKDSGLSDNEILKLRRRNRKRRKEAIESKSMKISSPKAR